mgnify:CR=1 FL=1
MDKLYDYIASKYDSSLYGLSLRKILDCGVDERYIDDINILKMFHDIYLDVKDKFDELDLTDIKNVSDKYLFLMNRIDEYQKLGNYNRDNYVIDYKPYVDNECINYVRQNCSSFSLEDFFSSNHFEKNIGGVCLISKKQTVCMYNDDSFGYIGSGYHNDSFHNIIKAIYNEKFIDDSCLKFNNTGQDIKVSFSNVVHGPLRKIRVFADIPVPINSGQLESLKLLNDEIKKYKNTNDMVIEVSCSIVNYYDEHFSLEFDNCNDLDEVLKWAIVSDSYKPFFEDKNLVGFMNGENYYNGSVKNLIK